MGDAPHRLWGSAVPPSMAMMRFGLAPDYGSAAPETGYTTPRYRGRNMGHVCDHIIQGATVATLVVSIRMSCGVREPPSVSNTVGVHGT